MTENNNPPTPEEKNEEKRDFKGIWIPKEVYLNTDLTWTEKICLVEINSLDNDSNKHKGCYASNEYLAKFLNVSVIRISNIISKLKKLGFIYQTSFNGRTRVLKASALNYSLRQPKTKLQGSHKVDFKESNIESNKEYSITPDLRSETQNTPPAGDTPSGPSIKPKLKVYNSPRDTLFKYYRPKTDSDRKYLEIADENDRDIINKLPELLRNYSKADDFLFALDEALLSQKLPENIFNKLDALHDILEKTETHVIDDAIRKANTRGNGNSLSYLWGIIRKIQGIKDKKEKLKKTPESKTAL